MGVGSVNLHGATSATASGPATLSMNGTTSTGTVTFTGIKDSAGNTVPDGTEVLASVVYCATRDPNFNCIGSTGGTIVDGAASAWNGNYKQFTVTNGSITLTYSTAGASMGTANVQLLGSQPNGTGITPYALIGGVWSININ